eukprot:2946997-Pyramimonas_sp.AAC.1
MSVEDTAAPDARAAPTADGTRTRRARPFHAQAYEALAAQERKCARAHCFRGRTAENVGPRLCSARAADGS